MLELLKEIILDSQKRPLFSGLPRRLMIRPVPRKATVCIGARRSGKSTYMVQILNRLLEQGVPRENTFIINFFDDRLHGLHETGLAPIVEAYFSLYPQKKWTEKIYCFLDEIQVFTGWEAFVERLLYSENMEIFITGSSAQMLSKELATQMRGRALAWELYPFSLREFLDFNQITERPPFSSKDKYLIQKAFETYHQVGGFPETLTLDKELRVKVHQEYFHAMLFRDLIERYDITHPKAILDLAYWLADHIASLYSINRLTGYLQALGHKVPKSTVADYLNWLEDAYFFFSVKKFDASLARANSNPKKIYCIDHALARSVNSGILVNSGHLLENFVFMELKRRGLTISYYKTQNGSEIDFISQDSNRNLTLFQVCQTLVEEQTKEREVRALTQAMQELRLKKAWIVTLQEEKEIHLELGVIYVLPAWRFALEEF